MSINEIMSETIRPSTLTNEIDSRVTYRFTLLLILAASISIFIRIDDISYVVESLFGEDGKIFINQSRELGFHSLWRPYNGMLFSYARVVALFTKPIPLVAIPYVFFLAWMMAFFSAVVVLRNYAKSAGLNELLIVFLVCAIALQPNHGEPFFNLTHSQYFLGIALAFYVCIPSQERASIPTIIFLILASLSGPFSTFLTVTLAVQLAILRDFSSRKLTYIVVPICGLIQSLVMLFSERAANTTIESAAAWFKAISSFFLFGGGNKLACVAAVMLWPIILIFFFKFMRSKTGISGDIVWISLLSTALSASVLYLAFMFASGTSLSTMSPIDMCSRYFLIPYSLVFFISLVCTKNSIAAHTTAIASICIICSSEFLSVDRPDRASSTGLLSHSNLQWTAFTKFREINPNIAIPLNPSWPVYPPIWRVEFKSSGVTDAASIRAAAIFLDPKQIKWETKADDFEAKTGSRLYLDIENHCATHRYIALEVDIWRSRMGGAKVYWGQPGRFEPERSLERFYPDGASVMQFAFRREMSDTLIRFQPTEGVAESSLVRSLSPYRQSVAPSGMVIGEPTMPGGEVRIDAVRLFCLGK